MKRLFSIILMTMLGFMTKVWADNISIESGKIAPNSTKIVSVVLNNTATNYVGFQMDFYLPKGLSIDKSKTTLTDRAESGSSITIGKQSNGAFRLVYSSLNLTPIKGTGGALINLCLKASADYSGGSIMVKNVVFGTTDSKTVRMDNVSFDMQRMTFVTVTANTIKMKYGDVVPELTYQKSDPSVKGTPTLSCEATSTSPVGTYPIVISKGSIEADEVKFVNGSLIIEKAPLTVSAGNYTKKQGDPMPEFKAAYDGFKNNETEDVLTKKPVIMTTATESSAPGEYPVTVSGAEAQNYDISYQPGTLTVTEAEVSDPVITLSGNELNISCSTARAIIYYTLNGNSPDENSSVYTEPVSLEASCQIKAIAKSFGVASNVVSTEYHNPQYPDIIKVGDVFTANIINNGVYSLPLYFKVTSIYPFEAELVRKEDYVQGWTNEYHIFGDLEVPAEVNYRNIKFKVVSIGELALSYCTHTYNLKLNEGLETIQQAAFRYINNIKELVIPNSVKRIEGTFVTECHSLKTITLGTGLQSLGMYAFWYVDGLRYIYSLNPIPPKFDDPNISFDDTPVDQITLYVPIGSKSAYENAPGWNLFAGRIVEIDPTGIADVTTDGLSITVSNHRIHVEGAKVGCFLNVYDLSGNKCMSVRITSGKVNINCNVPNGVYVVRLGNVSKKVVL